MTTYSLLFITEDECIARSRQVVCLTDEQALRTASREAGDHRAVEVWTRDRSVGLVEKHVPHDARHP